MKFLIAIAKIFSTLFSPLLMGTYGVALAMTLSFLCLIPAATKISVIFATFVASAVIPIILIFILHKLGIIRDPMLNDKGDRTWPYIIEIMSFIGVAVYFYCINAPTWLMLFMIGGTLALIILTVVNRWWKISGHATGVGGLCAMVFFLMISGNSIFSLQWEFMVILLLACAVCSSRLLLERHTLGQVAAGFLNGFLCVLILPLLLQAQQLPPAVQIVM